MILFVLYKTKILTSIKNFLTCVSVSNTSRTCILYALGNMCLPLMPKSRNCWIKLSVFFYCAQKVYSSIHKIWTTLHNGFNNFLLGLPSMGWVAPNVRFTQTLKCNFADLQPTLYCYNIDSICKQTIFPLSLYQCFSTLGLEDPLPQCFGCLPL